MSRCRGCRPQIRTGGPVSDEAAGVVSGLIQAVGSPPAGPCPTPCTAEPRSFGPGSRSGTPSTTPVPPAYIVRPSFRPGACRSVVVPCCRLWLRRSAIPGRPVTTRSRGGLNSHAGHLVLLPPSSRARVLRRCRPAVRPTTRPPSRSDAAGERCRSGDHVSSPVAVTVKPGGVRGASSASDKGVRTCATRRQRPDHGRPARSGSRSETASRPVLRHEENTT